MKARHGRAVREFLRLARWGERMGVAYRGSQGPLEYARALEARAPAKAPALEAAARLFEELVYAQGAGGRGERELGRAIDGIVGRGG